MLLASRWRSLRTPVQPFRSGHSVLPHCSVWRLRTRMRSSVIKRRTRGDRSELPIGVVDWTNPFSLGNLSQRTGGGERYERRAGRYLRRRVSRRSYSQLLTSALRSRAWPDANCECECSPSSRGRSSARFPTIRADQLSSTYSRARSLTIVMESLRTTGRGWDGPKSRNTTHWLENRQRLRRWRSPST